jgi:hypothetical protein
VGGGISMFRETGSQKPEAGFRLQKWVKAKHDSLPGGKICILIHAVPCTGEHGGGGLLLPKLV